MTATLARSTGTTSFPTLDESIPSRSRSSTLDSLARSRNPSLSQAQPSAIASTTSKDDTRPRPLMPRRSSSAMHREVLTRLRPLPFQYIFCAWHSKPFNSTPPPTTSSTSSSGSVCTETNNGLTLLSSTVKDIAAFYRIFNNTPWPSLRSRESIHFFRSGVQPLWEDPANLEGGCFVLKIRKEDSSSPFASSNSPAAEHIAASAVPKHLRTWEELCLLTLGGELQAAIFETGDHVLGLSYSPRLYHAVISIWTKQGRNEESRTRLEKAVLDGLSEDLRPKAGENGSGTEYYYKVHRDCAGFEEAVRANQQAKEVGSETDEVVDEAEEGQPEGAKVTQEQRLETA